MAELLGSPKNAGLDAGSASKAENVSIQVTSIRLTKDNYLSWSAALEIGITSRGRLSYITGDKPAPLKSDPQWETWALEDSQVKVWIISSVSSDIQPLILMKLTSFDMWTVLAKMYGCKKRHLRTYQIKQSIYSLTQGDLSVAAFYAALKTKWEELDYHVTDEWKYGSDHSLHWEKEWMDRTFLFVGGLRDEFEPIRSQILNGDEIPGIEEVYARVESEEQRRQVMHLTTGSVPSAFVSRASGTWQRPARRCTHCNKLGHSADFCWDLHPEKRLVRGRPPSGRRSPSLSDSSQGTPSSGVKTTKLSPDQLKELQAYIGRLSTTPEESSTKEKATVEDVVEEDRTNLNPAISLDDPSPSNEDLPIALRKGTRSITVSGSHPNGLDPHLATASEATLEASKERFSNVRNRRNPSAFVKTLNPLSLDETANRAQHRQTCGKRRERRALEQRACRGTCAITLLLAVSSSDNGFKVLANADGLRLLRTFENRFFDASRVASEAVAKGWLGRANFSVVQTDDFQMILGMEFYRAVKMVPMPHLRSVSIMDERHPCMVPAVPTKKDKGKAVIASTSQQKPSGDSSKTQMWVRTRRVFHLTTQRKVEAPKPGHRLSPAQ
ncbi:hypothetical protein EJ110_NYTH21693 [Nymphaea thermarum]|nr:hypothetical protein EJ110_NYTH21693 [Nymphaea thermarum]